MAYEPMTKFKTPVYPPTKPTPFLAISKTTQHRHQSLFPFSVAITQYPQNPLPLSLRPLSPTTTTTTTPSLSSHHQAHSLLLPHQNPKTLTPLRPSPSPSPAHETPSTRPHPPHTLPSPPTQPSLNCSRIVATLLLYPGHHSPLSFNLRIWGVLYQPQKMLVQIDGGLAILVKFFVPGLRIPKPVDFSQCLGDQVSESLLECLSALRTQIVVMVSHEVLAITRSRRKSATQHGGSILADLQQALEDYLPVLLGLVKDGSPLQHKVQFVWVNQEDASEETAMSNAWYEVLSVLHLMTMLS